MMSELAAHVVDIDIYHTTQDKCGLQPRPVLAHLSLRRRRTRRRTGRIRAPGKGRIARRRAVGRSQLHDRPDAALLPDRRRGVARDGHRAGAVRDRHRRRPARRSSAGSIAATPGARRCRRAATTARAAAPANSLNALVDGHRLSGRPRVSRQGRAADSARRSIPPTTSRRGDCDVPEQRWFYTMFLQSLGKYLRLQGRAGRARRDVRVRPREPAALRALDGRRTSIRISRSRRSSSFRPRPGRRRTSARATSSTSRRCTRSRSERATVHRAGAVLQPATRSRRSHAMPTRTLARPVVVLLTSGDSCEPWCQPRTAAGRRTGAAVTSRVSRLARGLRAAANSRRAAARAVDRRRAPRQSACCWCGSRCG